LGGYAAFTRGVALREAGDLTDAIAIFFLARETGADTAKCYDCMGLCYASAGNVDDAPEAEAAACFARAIEMFDLAILRRCETTIFLPSIS